MTAFRFFWGQTYSCDFLSGCDLLKKLLCRKPPDKNLQEFAEISDNHLSRDFLHLSENYLVLYNLLSLNIQ